MKKSKFTVWNGEEWRTLSNLYLGDGNIQEFNCANAKLYPSTYNAGELYNGVLDVPYIGGNGVYVVKINETPLSKN